MSAPRPLQNVIWLLGERFARAGITAITLAAVARHLAPAGFGSLNFALAITLIAASFASLGIEGVIIKELIQQPRRTGVVLGTAFRLRLMIGVALIAVITVSAWTIPGLVQHRGLIIILSLGLLFLPLEVIDLCFQKHLDSRRTVKVRLLSIGATGLFRLTLVAWNAPLIAFAWAQVVEFALFALGLVWAWKHSPHRSGPWSWDPALARIFWGHGISLGLAAFIGALSSRLDQLMVWYWLSEREAGIYFAATRLTEIPVFIGTALMVSLFPALAAALQQSPEAYRERLRCLCEIMAGLGWLAAVGFTLGGPLAIDLLYGPSYAGAATVLSIQGWTVLFILINNVRWHFVLLSAPAFLNLAVAFANIALQLLLGWLGIRQFGASGAACGALIAVLVSSLALSWTLTPLRDCAVAQTRGILIPFTPWRWRQTWAQLRG